MDKREFVQRYIIENFDNGNIYRDIETAVIVFDAIEETMAERSIHGKPGMVFIGYDDDGECLWDYNDK
jgi:hypothetical protein